MSDIPYPAFIVFDRFVDKKPNDQVDASRIVSTECYQAWLQSRLRPPKNPTEAFRKSITSHCRGVHGMRCFTPKVEAAVLKIVRQKRVWPCFEVLGLKTGNRGFQGDGYWESAARNCLVEDSSLGSGSSTATPIPIPIPTTADASVQVSESQCTRQELQNQEPGHIWPGYQTTTSEVSISASDLISLVEEPEPETRKRSFSLHQADGAELNALLLGTDSTRHSNLPNDYKSLLITQQVKIGVPYFLSSVYHHNEHIYGRTTHATYEPPDEAFLGVHEINQQFQNPEQQPQKRASYSRNSPIDLAFKHDSINMTTEQIATSSTEFMKSMNDIEDAVDEDNQLVLDLDQVLSMYAKHSQLCKKKSNYDSLPCLCGHTFSRKSSKTLTHQVRKGLTGQQACLYVTCFIHLGLENEVFGACVNVVRKYIPKHLLTVFTVNFFRQNGFQVFCPKQLPLRAAMDANLKYLFSKAFCLPSQKEKTFDQRKPVGALVGDLATFCTVDVNPTSKEIYRGSIVGVHSLKLRVHKYHAMMYVEEMLTDIFERGEVWTRSIEYRLDGTVMVLLNHYKLYVRQTNYVICRHQDVSDQFVQFL